MKNKNELLKVLEKIEKEIKHAKKLGESQEMTDTQEIQFGFHLSQIQDLSKSIRDILDS